MNEYIVYSLFSAVVGVMFALRRSKIWNDGKYYPWVGDIVKIGWGGSVAEVIEVGEALEVKVYSWHDDEVQWVYPEHLLFLSRKYSRQ